MASAEAKIIARRQHDHVRDILQPSRGIRDDMERIGIKPKDHAKENREHIRKVQYEQYLAKEQALAEKSMRPSTPKQYQHVTSAVEAIIQSSPSEDEQARHEFLKAHSRPHSARPQSAGRASPRIKAKPPVPKASEVLHVQRPSSAPRDHIQRNSREASKAPSRAHIQTPPPTTNPKEINPNFGKTPDYIVQRQIAEASEALRKQEEARKRAECPAGMRIVPDAEKNETLAILRENQQNLLRELQTFPLQPTSFGQQQRRAHVEARLRDVEDAIKLYSQKKVFVAL
eukprot:TRINITY_DN9716_c0_g2_i1.p1 TRINITY_DN9716_c0_g2~~TRINITY_DN9716_c0_g2_i1.p1  ORF type:complete len:286 (+),score=55.90 TRINITY_DN9716_c0_g2_i1:44-901(+)